MHEGNYAGFAIYTFRGEGPLAPGLGDYHRTYGARALRPWLVFHLSEARCRSRGLYICSMEVLPTFQCQGVGTAMFSALLERAAALGAPIVKLDVRMTNPRARALYERLGFKPIRYPLLPLDGLKVAMAPGYQRMARGAAPTRPPSYRNDIPPLSATVWPVM